MSRKPNKEVEDIKQIIRKPIQDDERVEFLDSGSTMFNLAASQKGRDGGWARGRIVNPVGDGSSGKTIMAIEACVNAFYNIKKRSSKIFPPVEKLSLVYANRERVMDFPLTKMYRQDFVNAVEWNHNVVTVEDFGKDFGRRAIEHKQGECLIYVLDSWDSITSEVSQKRFRDAALGKEIESGSYNTDKAAYASKEFFNNICDLMAGKDITLFIISQTRTKIGITFGDKHYRSGGDALNFYTHQVPWLSEVEKLTKTYHGDKWQYGVRMRAKFKRNKTAKPNREAETVILYDIGIDNIWSMINWYWGPEVKKIHFDDTDFSREDLIRYIEDNDLEDVLIGMCEEEWAKTEEVIIPVRKSRFGNPDETPD
jgi:RecA/RadA recombinase